MLSDMSVDVLVSVIEGDTKVIITAKGEGFVDADTVHRDKDVQRHIVALQLFRDQLCRAGGVTLRLRGDTGFTLLHLAPLLLGDRVDGVTRNLERTGYCGLTIPSSESVDDAFSDYQGTALCVMPFRCALRQCERRILAVI